MLPVIKGNRLDSFINSTNPCPPQETVIDKGSEPNPKHDEWMVKDQLLLGWLYSSITPEVAAQLINCTTSQQLWTSIEQMTGAATRAKELWYKGEIQRTRKGSMKMKEYLNKMKSIADNLQLVGSPLSLKDLYAQILCGLDSEYTAIVTQLTYMPHLSWIEFSTALLTFETRIEQLTAIQNLSINSGVVNLVQTQKHSNNDKDSWRGSGRGRGRGRGRNNSSRPICQICRKTGHLASVCYYRTNMSYMGSTPNSNKQQQQNSKKGPYSAYIATPETVADQNWCLDTGASHHVTNYIDQLQQVNKFHGKTALIVGNGNSVPIKHIGSKVLSAQSGKHIKLNNVLHSPHIARNLISVYQLTSHNNLIVEFDSDSFCIKDKATKKDLLRGMSRDGLYVLETEEVVNMAPQAFTISSNNHQNSIEDWHNKLGHPSYSILQKVLRTCNVKINETSFFFLQCLSIW